MDMMYCESSEASSPAFPGLFVPTILATGCTGSLYSLWNLARSLREGEVKDEMRGER